jgi:glutaredoxin|tara:strand:- start:406 stop:819 length:414 start_codon:yes stop_codon:yes gene_type:complete
MSTNKNKEEIILYSNENCKYCKELIEKFNDKKIKYKNVSTEKNTDKWVDVINLTTMPTTPTVLYKDTYFVAGRDFQNPEHLINIINNFKTSKFSVQKQTNERLKTLNYHINIAFQRIDQLLRQIETKIDKNEHKSTD